MSKFLVCYDIIEWFPLNDSGLTSSNYTELSHLYENFKDKGTLLMEHKCLFIFPIFLLWLLVTTWYFDYVASFWIYLLLMLFYFEVDPV